MKLDIKSIIILVLIVISCFSCWRWLIRGDKEAKTKIEELNQDFKKLKRVKDSLDNSILNLEKRFDSLQKVDFNIEKRNQFLESQVEQAQKRANQSESELKRIIQERKEIIKKIEDLKKNPIKREGNDLLESLKNKTK